LAAARLVARAPRSSVEARRARQNAEAADHDRLVRMRGDKPAAHRLAGGEPANQARCRIDRIRVHAAVARKLDARTVAFEARGGVPAAVASNEISKSAAAFSLPASLATEAGTISSSRTTSRDAQERRMRSRATR